MSAVRRRLENARHRIGAGRRTPPGHPLRLVVEKATWLDDAQSAVMLSIDDLTNAWHDRGGGRRWEQGGDWGGGLRGDGSALRFLEERLLADFPQVRTTFFTVAGPISPYTRHQPFSFAAALDASGESRRFFRAIADDPRFELAYHGYNHGTPGVETAAFLQEFRGFESLDAAVEQTRRGIEIFTQAIGRAPRGGKYGGWDYNEFGDAAVDACGFQWWCRDWTPRDVTGVIPDAYYEPQLFGRGGVIALPTTVHGRFWTHGQVERLLACRQLIAVEEHIAPVRPDGLVQTPNIVDDIDELRALFAYLRSKDVWYATGSEVAAYVAARERTTVHDVAADGFAVSYVGGVPRPRLTLRVNCASPGTTDATAVRLTQPDGTVVDASRDGSHHGVQTRLFTIDVMDGRYRVASVPA